MAETYGESKKEVEDLAICSAPMLSQPYPWLMIYGQDKEQQTFYSISNNRSYSRFIHELHMNEFIICSTNKRWLVYQDHCTKECFLLNISTMEKLPLPPIIESLPHYPFIVLSSPIVDAACRIVLFDLYPYRYLSCNVSDTEFMDREVTFEKGDFYFDGSVNLDGKLYALTTYYDLLTTDYSDPHLVLKPIIDGQALKELLPMHYERKNYLLESCGEILFIYTRSRDSELTDIKVFRADFNINKWVRVERLGDRAVFLDANHSFSSPASMFGLRGNCVYFVNSRGNNLFVFDMKDKSISMSLPSPIAGANSHIFWMLLSSDAVY